MVLANYNKSDWKKSDRNDYKYMIDIWCPKSAKLIYESPKNPMGILVTKKSDITYRLYMNNPVDVEVVKIVESKKSKKEHIRVEEFKFIEDLNSWLKDIEQEDFIDIKKFNNTYLLIYIDRKW